jgi:transmembrane sensor
MDETILKVLNGRASSHELATMREWRRQDPANDEYYRGMEVAWNLTAAWGPTPTGRRPTAADVLSRSEVMELAHPRPRFRGRRFTGTAVAAAASLAIGFGLAQVQRPTAPGDASPLEMITMAGEMVTLRMPDGTVVRLSPESRLRVRGDIGPRTVAVEGRAFFAVAHDPHHPFIIRSPSGEAQVLGTRLEVTASDDEFAVAVIEGQVAVSRGTSQVVLQAGERTTTKADEMVVEAGDPAVPAWLGSFAAFQATPLRTVAVEMEQRFGMQVVVEDPALMDRTVTAWFADTSAEDIMRVICKVTDVRCTIAGATTTIRRR